MIKREKKLVTTTIQLNNITIKLQRNKGIGSMCEIDKKLNGYTIKIYRTDQTETLILEHRIEQMRKDTVSVPIMK